MYCGLVDARISKEVCNRSGLQSQLTSHALYYKIPQTGDSKKTVLPLKNKAVSLASNHGSFSYFSAADEACSTSEK